MEQDRIFLDNEGNNWFRRNKSALDETDKIDWPFHVLNFIDFKVKIGSVLELGCSNGYRLDKIRSKLLPDCRFVGIDAGAEAIEYGRMKFEGLELFQGLLSDIPLKEEFDLVIVNFVLHWVDRKTLFRSIGEIDRVIKDGGLLVLGDFLPDYQQRRRYHHLPNEHVYTYKQDYAKIFESFGTYRELARFTFNHDNVSGYTLEPALSSERGFCSLLHKSHESYYPEV